MLGIQWWYSIHERRACYIPKIGYIWYFIYSNPPDFCPKSLVRCELALLGSGKSVLAVGAVFVVANSFSFVGNWAALRILDRWRNGVCVGWFWGTVLFVLRTLISLLVSVLETLGMCLILSLIVGGSVISVSGVWVVAGRDEEGGTKGRDGGAESDNERRWSANHFANRIKNIFNYVWECKQRIQQVKYQVSSQNRWLVCQFLRRLPNSTSSVTWKLSLAEKFAWAKFSFRWHFRQDIMDFGDDDDHHDGEVDGETLYFAHPIG